MRPLCSVSFWLAIILAATLASATNVFASGAAPTCLGNSDASDMSVEKELTGHIGNTFLHHYRDPHFIPSCPAKSTLPAAMRAPSSLSLALTTAKQAADRANPQLLLNPSCVAAALANRSVDIQRYECAADGATPTPLHQKGRHGPTRRPCLTPNYAGFVSSTLNQAIQCLSTPDSRLNPDVVFGFVNAESGFLHNIAGSNGIGLMQLTSDAARGVLWTDQEGFEFLKKRMALNLEECRPFLAVVEELKESRSGDARRCQFMTLGNGVARSALVGLSLFLTYRDSGLHYSARQLIKKLQIRKPGVDAMISSLSPAEQQMLADQLALQGYNSGQTSMPVLLDKAIDEFNRNHGRISLVNAMIKHSEYLQAIQDKRTEANVGPSCSLRPR